MGAVHLFSRSQWHLAGVLRCLTRDIGTEDDVTMQVRFERSIEAMRTRDRLREAGTAATSATL